MSAKAKRSVIAAAAVLAALAVSVILLLMLRSSLEYRIMSSTEQLKAQLKRECPVSEERIVEKIEVLRLQYSLSAEKWTFLVTFSSGSNASIR